MHHLKRSLLVSLLALALTILLTTTIAQAAGLTGKKWSIVPSPNGTRASYNELLDVAAISASDIWAVGDYYASRPRVHTLIEHWNGTNWQIVSSPNVGSGDNFLSGVARVPGGTNLWAVGYSVNSSSHWKTLTEFYG